MKPRPRPNPGPTPRRTGWLIGGGILAVAVIAVVFVLPAETGFDPLGTGRATGLDKIAEPDNPELERGLLRTGVLALSDTPPAPAPGIGDTWEYVLAPYESIEFKYTMAKGRPVSFRWEATGPLNYDMHAHPFDGGTDLTESYSIGKASALQGSYTPAFTGLHGWYWDNRSTDNVTLRLTASGPMTTSTIFGGGTETKRPLEGARGTIEGTVQGHEMQGTSGT